MSGLLYNGCDAEHALVALDVLYTSGVGSFCSLLCICAACSVYRVIGENLMAVGVGLLCSALRNTQWQLLNSMCVMRGINGVCFLGV